MSHCLLDHREFYASPSAISGRVYADDWSEGLLAAATVPGGRLRAAYLQQVDSTVRDQHNGPARKNCCLMQISMLRFKL